jgi:hypothetical protein
MAMSERPSLLFKVWPLPYQKLWLKTVATQDEWLEESRLASWKPRTRQKARLNFGHWLRFLDRTGCLDPLHPPTALAQPEIVKAFIRDQLTRVQCATVSNMLFHLTALFETWDPERDWGWLRQLRARVKRKAEREWRPAQLQLPRAQDVFDLGLELLQRATMRSDQGEIDAELFIHGLAIATLIAMER